MSKKSLWLMVLVLSFGLIVWGCPKKTVVKEEPSVKKEREEAARLEREAKAKEEEAKRELEKFEKSLVAKKRAGYRRGGFRKQFTKGYSLRLR